MIRNFDELLSKRDRAKGKIIAVAASNHLHTLKAVFDAEKEFGISYLLVGHRMKTLEICEKMGKSISDEKIIPADTEEEAASKTVALVKEKRADLLMKGNIQTAALLKAVLNKEKGISTGGVMCHMAVIEARGYDRLLFMSDGGMIPYPTLDQKRAIIEEGVKFMHSLGYSEPKVAILSAVETVNEKMPETLEAKELTRLNQEGIIKGCIAEGPLSMDLAISPESAAIKGIKSRIGSKADFLVMPNISAGNIMSKALTFLGGAKMAGCILGAEVPIVLSSRGASEEEKRLSILLCLSL